MTGHTSTIDDASPLIEYQPEGAWLQQSDDTSGGTTKYYGGSYTYTELMGATASFSFNGTSITIQGAKWVDYGDYSVNIDGTAYEGFAFTYSSGLPDTPLFNTTSLRQGPHTVTLRNAGSSRLDIDSITWTSDIEPSGEGEIHKDEYSNDDTFKGFEYYPEEAWLSQYNLSDFMSNTGHTTSVSKASVIYTFSDIAHPNTGDIVSLYGTTGPLNSPYTVQLDNWPNKTFQGNRPTYKAQSLLYYADNLGPGDHTLIITNEADSKLQIDYATLHRFASSPSGTTFSMPGPTGGAVNQGRGLNGTQLAGIITGLGLILVLIISLVLLSRRNRTLWHRLQRGYMVQSQFDTSCPSIESGYYIPTSSRSSRNGSEVMTHESQHKLGHSRDVSETQVRPPTIRPLSLVSRMSSSASTLVAEDGSNSGGRSQRRTKEALNRTVGNPILTSTQSLLSPREINSIQSPNPFFGPKPTVESLNAHSELDIMVLYPEGHSINGNLAMPSRSLAARGRSSPGPTNRGEVPMDTTIYRERSPSPAPELSTTGEETWRLIDSEKYILPPDSNGYLSLAGRTPRHVHGARASNHYHLFKSRRYI